MLAQEGKECFLRLLGHRAFFGDETLADSALLQSSAQLLEEIVARCEDGNIAFRCADDLGQPRSVVVEHCRGAVLESRGGGGVDEYEAPCWVEGRVVRARPEPRAPDAEKVGVNLGRVERP